MVSQNNLKMFLGVLSVVRRAIRCRKDNFTWLLNKHKHSISNVFIFRVISFNDFWKCLRAQTFNMQYSCVLFFAFLVGFVGSPRVSWGF